MKGKPFAELSPLVVPRVVRTRVPQAFEIQGRNRRFLRQLSHGVRPWLRVSAADQHQLAAARFSAEPRRSESSKPALSSVARDIHGQLMPAPYAQAWQM